MTSKLRRPLNLVWVRQVLEQVLEGHFINELLLAELDRPIRRIVVEQNERFPFLSDALYVSFGTHLTDYLKEAWRRGYTNLGLLHMADEFGKQDRSFYGSVDYVLRHYWFKHALDAVPGSLGVIWIPNGYRTGVGPITPQTLPTSRDRDIIGFFAGAMQGRALSDERQRMVSIITQGKLPFIISETQGFGHGLNPIAYAAYLCRTRFGLVPGGNSPETIRLYDVLEAGAIPIMLRSPFVSAPDGLGSPPFVLLDDWSDLPSFYERYSDAMAPRVIDEREGRRQDVYNWWTRFKSTQQRRLKDLVDRSFARAHGDE